MRTKVLAALVASGALLGGSGTAAREVKGMSPISPSTRATVQRSLDVTGPRVDPRTRTGAVSSAGSIPDLARGRASTGFDSNEPERQQDRAVGIGGSGPAR